MTDRLAIALAQLNPTVGDVAGNAALVRRARAEAARQGADLVVFPELVLSGYPPEDLVLKPAFQDACMAAARALAAETADGGPALLLGTPWREDGRLHNAVLLLDGGTVAASRFKVDLPNYGVFDEKRVFAPGPMPGPINFRDVRIGAPVCEDIWSPGVVECLEETGAELLLVPNGSPYEQDKPDHRLNHVVGRVTESRLPMAYVNQVGGQDELVFDGASFVLNGDRTLKAQLPAWEEAVALTRWERGANGGWSCVAGPIALLEEGLAATWQALTLGLRDYVNKTGFPGVLIGLSGGIDSALAAAIAVDALGPDRVRCVMMPSPYTAQASIEDAAACAAALGVGLDTVPIEPAMRAFDGMLAPLLEGRADGVTADGVTAENVQARSRGLALMALSNALGAMVVATGNKSEMSVGYATLYGDMNGGYAVLKDVYKTGVFALARWRNANRPKNALGPAHPVVPERIITKPPSAELRPGQTDQDTLPPYDVLDDILDGLVERELSAAEIAARGGHDPALVQRVRRMLDRAEYKRRQAPPGVKISSRAFGRDRRYPIVNGYRGAV